MPEWIAKGLLKDGGSKRPAAAQQTLKSAGGQLQRSYFASLAILASGAVHRDRLLLVPEEIEEAAKGAHEWRDAVVRQNLIALD